MIPVITPRSLWPKHILANSTSRIVFARNFLFIENSPKTWVNSIRKYATTASAWALVLPRNLMLKPVMSTLIDSSLHQNRSFPLSVSTDQPNPYG